MNHLSYIEISREAVLFNLQSFRSQLPDHATIAAVIKANAYGHGMHQIAQVLEYEVDAFQVDDIDELRQLRLTTNRRALVYGYVSCFHMEEALGLNAELSIFAENQIQELAWLVSEKDLPGEFSIKIDALLGRLGVLPSELDSFIELIELYGFLEPESAYAHYANIEDTTDLSHALDQEEVFEAAFKKLSDHWYGLGRHMSATSGILARPEKRNSVFRLGIGLYGLYPSAPLARSHAHLDLKPVMRWVTHLAQVKTLPAGHPVGYGLTYRTTRPTTIGIVPQGYSDGYDRGLSNVGEVLVHGRRCPVIGRIAMNMFAIDLTPAPDARAEDEVVLLGGQGEDRITAEEIAQKLGTINYEVVARVSPLLPRIVV